MSVEKVTVPDIGGAEGAEVIELLVAVGDKVALDQGLIVLESDKASMEIPSTVAGNVVELLAAVGDQLAEGAPVAMIESDAAEAGSEDTGQDNGDDAPDAPQEKADAGAGKGAADKDTAEKDAAEKAGSGQGDSTEKDAAQTPAEKAEADSSAESAAPAAEPAAEKRAAPEAAASPARSAADTADDSAPVYAGPAVRKLAREFGVQLGRVVGTGPHSRILKEDIQQYVQQALQAPAAGGAAGSGVPAVPEIDFGKFGEVEVSERSKLDKLTAANMHRSWLNVPHVTQFDDADISDLEDFRKRLKAEAERRDTRLTPVPFLLKACAVALRDNPKLASSLARDGQDLVYKKYTHIGMAVDTPAGLMVPVIRDVDRKTIWELAAEVADMAARARDRKLSPADMQGGCFTISSLGTIGGNGFTPIVNTPEVAILGVSKASIKPLWNGSEFVPRTMLPLALSYDHRVVNGGDGGRFLTQLVALLSDIRQLSM